MILFLTNKNDCKSKQIYEKLRKKSSVSVEWLAIEDIIKNSSISIKSNNSDLLAQVHIYGSDTTVDLSDVKVCYIAQYPYISSEWIPYEKKHDISYAEKEWWASFIALLQSQSHIKYINPIELPCDLASEMTHLFLFQKFDVDTVDMVLTNNKEDAVEYYQMWDKCVLGKTVRNGYYNSAVLDISKLARLNKLHLCPAMFQRSIPGTELAVGLVGNKFIIQKIRYEDNEVIKESVDIPKALKEKLVRISEFNKTPIVIFNFIYQDDTDEYFAYSINPYVSFDMAYEAFGESFIQLLTNYLIEEHNG